MNLAVLEKAISRMSPPDLMRAASLVLLITAARMQSRISFGSIAFLLLGAMRVDSVDGGFLLSLRGIPMSLFSMFVPR